MSWSKQFTCSIESIEKAAELVAPSLTTGYAEDEQQAAIRIATQASILAAGVVGPPSAEVRVTISGHANPDNEPTAGYAKDEVRITVTRI